MENLVNIEDEFEGVRKNHVIKHLGNLFPIQEINASEYNEESFLLNNLQINRPLVIRNALNVFDCGQAFNKWDLEYLNEKCGSNKVFVRRNTLEENYKTGKAYQVQEIEFKTYVKDLLENNLTSRNSYLAVQNLKKAFYQVSDELKMPPFVQKLHAGPFLWIARKDHYEYTHMDPDDNLLTVIRGRKLVRLYGCKIDTMFVNELGSKGRTLQSQINCDQIQAGLSDEIVENFKKTDCYYCLLREGDMLYFPAFWWHQVKSPELTISVNAFFGDSGENNFTSKILSSDQKDAFMYWIYNIVKQNMPYPSFNRILINLKESLKSFLFKQWHESLSNEQVQVIYENILDYFDLRAQLNELSKLDLEYKSKNPPALRIRGLLMRNAKNHNNNNNNSNSQINDSLEED